MNNEELKVLNKEDIMEKCRLLGIDKIINKGLLVEWLQKLREDRLRYLSSSKINNP